MFLMADVRAMAKNGELKGNPDYIRKLIDFPINAYEFLSLYKENHEVIEKKIDSEERYEMYENIFAVPEDADAETARASLAAIEMIHFDDSKSKEECVFGIGINRNLKRVDVLFRGSVTPKDFHQDLKVGVWSCRFGSDYGSVVCQLNGVSVLL